MLPFWYFDSISPNLYNIIKYIGFFVNSFRKKGKNIKKTNPNKLHFFWTELEM